MPTDTHYEPIIMRPGWILEQVISGMQTGVDQAALEIAADLNYRTGGVAPKHWATDEGPNPQFGEKYGLVESSFKGYVPRTRANVKLADVTVWFGVPSAGMTCTFNAIAQFRKPYLLNPSVSELQDFILKHGFKVLNVAGNRLRTHPESTATARVILTAGLLPF